MNDIFVRYADMPLSVKGCTVLDENGDYNTYINLRYTYEIQMTVMKHELKHIENGDFYSFEDIRDKENNNM